MLDAVIESDDLIRSGTTGSKSLLERALSPFRDEEGPERKEN